MGALLGTGSAELLLPAVEGFPRAGLWGSTARGWSVREGRDFPWLPQ